MTGRADRRYCSTRCRVAAHRARGGAPLDDYTLADGALQQALDFGRGEIFWFLSAHVDPVNRAKIAEALEESARAIRDLDA